MVQLVTEFQHGYRQLRRAVLVIAALFTSVSTSAERRALGQDPTKPSSRILESLAANTDVQTVISRDDAAPKPVTGMDLRLQAMILRDASNGSAILKTPEGQRLMVKLSSDSAIQEQNRFSVRGVLLQVLDFSSAGITIKSVRGEEQWRIN